MKGNLLMGTGRGKLGDVVARVLHGEQVFSKYQPVVYNPKSQRQSLIRDFFTKASVETKSVMAKAVDNFMGLYYSNLYGASRNARNLFMQIGMKARILVEDGLSNIGIANVLPISSIGQNFNLYKWTYTDETDQMASFIPNVAGAGLSNLYFGSDVLLTANTKFLGFGTAYSSNNIAVGNVGNEVDLVLTPNPVGSAEPAKSFGIFENLADVTGWAYTYKIDVDPSTGWETFGVNYSQNVAGTSAVNSAYAFITWQDMNGRIIMQRSITGV